MAGFEKHHIRLVAGLGNPGSLYARSRHNVGFMVVDEIARQAGIPMHLKGGSAWVGEGRIDAVDTLVVKPVHYMNRSGPPVYRIAEQYGVAVTDIMVVHDDIDLAFGRLKIKQKGGDGGHRGIRSMVGAFGGDAFARLRIGIGRPGPETSIIDFVLGEFTAVERETLPGVISSSRKAVCAFLSLGIQECMNQFNRREWVISS